MTTYLYRNSSISTNNKLDFLFSEYKQIQKSVEDELINKAEQLSNLPSDQIKDYHALAKAGVNLLRKKIFLAYPQSAESSTPEAFVAQLIVNESERKFNSSNGFGGKLDRILKKLPEIKDEAPVVKPYSFTVNVDWGVKNLPETADS